MKPSLIAELVPSRCGDQNTIPAVVKPADGTPAYFVADTVEAIRETPRLQYAYEGAPILNAPIKKGESFRVDWVFGADDGELYYYTPFGTRVKVADTKRVADGEAA